MMTRNLLTLAVVGAIALGGFALAQGGDKEDRGGRGWHKRGQRFEHMVETLNLTPEQKAKAVMDSTMTQIRPMLTKEQQKKFDDMKAAHEQMRDAAKKLHDAANE